mmetsp:Transcript_7075/g.21331  ORF Transcript_7075/g.21331 Transcript_7075/m.21331 type:complete len:201 (-) Transcript_7075:572-1174(-)
MEKVSGEIVIIFVSDTERIASLPTTNPTPQNGTENTGRKKFCAPPMPGCAIAWFALKAPLVNCETQKIQNELNPNCETLRAEKNFAGEISKYNKLDLLFLYATTLDPYGFSEVTEAMPPCSCVNFESNASLIISILFRSFIPPLAFLPNPNNALSSPPLNSSPSPRLPFFPAAAHTGFPPEYKSKGNTSATKNTTAIKCA